MTSVLSEYIKIYNEHYNKYGKKIAVIMQVGSFYECYGIDNGKDTFGNAKELSRILNIVLTRRSKKILANSMHNPLMLGFPCLAFSKYLPMLLEEDYTVVIVDQEKTILGVKRSVVDVVSPSTYVEGNIQTDNFLIVLYVDKHLHIGMSAISVSTGNSVVHECYSDPDDKDRSLDDALGFIKRYKPTEISIGRDGCALSAESITSYLELDSVLCHDTVVEKNKHNVAYQEAVLGCAFEYNKKSMLSNIENLHLERTPYALMSYVLLIKFVHDHNPMLLRKISRPDIFSGSDNLVLATSTIDQLNIHGTNRSWSKKNVTNTLFGVINKCSTNVGKRLLLRRILSPTANVATLNNRYDEIDKFGALYDTRKVEKLLKEIVDVERFQRRMSMGIMFPSELAGLHASYSRVLQLDDLLKTKSFSERVRLSNNNRDILIEFVETCACIFDIENSHMLTSNMETVEFRRGTFADLDELTQRMNKKKQIVTEFAAKISFEINAEAKLEYLQNVGYCVIISNAQAKKLKNIKHYDTKQSKTSTRITSPDVDAVNRKVCTINEKLKLLTHKRYKKTLEYLSSGYYSGMFKQVTKFVSEIDVIKSNWTTSKLYNYCRPEIKNNNKSNFVDAKDLRHPIIERIDDGNEYVPNNVTIGKEYNGIILYSMNSCGKTSLMKALGLSVVMAQAGCFVPASSYSFYPFKCLMTRILSRDNFMKGQSSFVAEMSELKAILKRAKDSSTLVLADEITHGTEHTSGSAIFVSSVEALAKRKVNFMFTTHLHNAYPFVRVVPNVRTFHLSVAFDDDRIVFERKMKDGPGGSIYGLEVCEHLNMDVDFLSRAFQLRNMITPDKTENDANVKNVNGIKITKYNKQKIKQACETCGYSPRLLTDLPLDVHHVKHQSHADESGMINGTSVHAKSNLIVLCKQCHTKQHQITKI